VACTVAAVGAVLAAAPSPWRAPSLPASPSASLSLPYPRTTPHRPPFQTRIDCRWVVDEAANVRSKRRLTILGDAASSRGPACFELGASCATLFHLCV